MAERSASLTGELDRLNAAASFDFADTPSAATAVVEGAARAAASLSFCMVSLMRSASDRLVTSGGRRRCSASMVAVRELSMARAAL